MDRFYAEDINVLNIKEAIIKSKLSPNHIKKGEDGLKTHSIMTTRKYSFLYIDDLNQLGDNKEYVIKGKVIDILKLRDMNIRNMNPGYMNNSSLIGDRTGKGYEVDNTYITVDISKPYETKIINLAINKILNVQDIDYEWDLTENPELLWRDNDGMKQFEPEHWDMVNPSKKPHLVTENYL